MGSDIVWLSLLMLFSLSMSNIRLILRSYIFDLLEANFSNFSEPHNEEGSTSLLENALLLIVSHCFMSMLSLLVFYASRLREYVEKGAISECMRELVLHKVSKIVMSEKQERFNFGIISTILFEDVSTISSSKYVLSETHSHIGYLIMSFFTMVYTVGLFASCCSFVFLLFTVPVYIYFIKKQDTMRKENLEIADEKSSVLSQFIHAIKLIKVFAIENVFINKFENIEAKARKNFNSDSWIAFIIESLYHLQSFMVSFICFFVYSYIEGKPITLGLALTVSSLSDCLRWPFYSLSSDLRQISQMRIASKRIANLLMCKEHKYHTEFTTEVGVLVEMQNVSAKWNFEPCNNNTYDNSIIRNISLKIHEGEHVALISKVGMGKSTLLYTILNETNIIHGNVRIKEGLSIGFVSQNVWIRNGTIRENVVFCSSNFDQKRYELALWASDFAIDVEQMTKKDDQMIGERGINLSGGQKIRLSLARALYHDCDLYLLDDIFSAVDIHTASNIVDRLFQSENALLKNKSILLVTHQLHLLKMIDRTFVMDKGEIIQQGSNSEIIDSENMSDTLKDLLSSTHNVQDETKSIFQTSQHLMEQSESDEREDGKSSFESVLEEVREDPKIIQIIEFMMSLGRKSSIFLLSIVTLGLIEQFAPVFKDYILSCWIMDEHYEQHPLVYYFSLYNVGAFCEMISYTLNSVVVGYFLYLVGDVYQSLILEKLAQSKLKLFETVPSGKIIERVYDTSEIRNNIRYMFQYFISTAFKALVTIVIILFTVPISIVLFAIVAPITNYYRNTYSTTEQQVLDYQTSNLYDPTYTISSEILEGIDTIRAFDREKKMTALISEIRERNHFINKLTYCNELLWNWFSVRCGFAKDVTISLILLVIFLYYYKYYHEQNVHLSNDTMSTEKMVPIQVVIALFYQRVQDLIDSSETLFYTFTKTATSFRPVQRILDFVKQLPLDGTQSVLEKPKDLHFEGTVIFDRVSMKYSPECNYALNNISFSVKQGAKCGIVGRTGSGKSSIFNCILRLQEIEKNEGAIYMDGIDIRELPIRDLRKSITFIPQQPILFMGTLRENMDFEGAFSDQEIITALEQVGLLHTLKEKSAIVKGEEQSILDIKITENGTNFSSGEKQLICLARALLRKTKILLMDEGTSNLDNFTDSIIQNTLRGPLFSNTTVLVIAHRIETVKDYEKIILMSDGIIAKQGSADQVLMSSDEFIIDSSSSSLSLDTISSSTPCKKPEEPHVLTQHFQSRSLQKLLTKICGISYDGGNLMMELHRIDDSFEIKPCWLNNEVIGHIIVYSKFKTVIVNCIGSKSILDWVSNFLEFQSTTKMDSKSNVEYQVCTWTHSGANLMLSEFQKVFISLLQNHDENSYQVFCCGHSRGAAITSYTAFLIAREFQEELAGSVYVKTLACPAYACSEFQTLYLSTIHEMNICNVLSIFDPIGLLLMARSIPGEVSFIEFQNPLGFFNVLVQPAVNLLQCASEFLRNILTAPSLISCLKNVACVGFQIVLEPGVLGSIVKSPLMLFMKAFMNVVGYVIRGNGHGVKHYEAFERGVFEQLSSTMGEFLSNIQDVSMSIWRLLWKFLVHLKNIALDWMKKLCDELWNGLAKFFDTIGSFFNKLSIQQ
ncbi:hypothetical protein C9374_013467 [Naegleria lovaniensis]|uniref:Uncharacterized protein n=1 Tax=Naegleria lovaniensis TaxID=51637 RepID=A0AA88H2E2_NAELO|nr:uncharacterized protein C9374_013467 [Naegleria lovaniensis]KAG2391982.1 hypothetical protein C9374_013467 [Naegleria lovaniensis]